MLIHSWRWFGPNDRIRLDQVIQTGAVNIVSALHDVPVGVLWTGEDIIRRKRMIEDAGLTWTVVESVPVHEDIKKKTGKYDRYIDNFIQTLINLGESGIRTLCYNFMPALDWSRTNLKFRMKDGGESLFFNYIHFAAIDIFILKRPGAVKSYPESVAARAETFYKGLDEQSKRELRETFLLGFPGSGESFTLDEVLKRIKGYDGIDKGKFRENLAYFLGRVIPEAEKAGVKLAIHPDDPPWSLMGMPRVMSTLEDVEFIIGIIDSPFNGLTFCTGSLGASHTNDIPDMMVRLAHRINFAHLRNVSRDADKNFHEDFFLTGDVDMYRVMKILVEEDIRRSEKGDTNGIPLRPDHGAQILGDLSEKNYPGYSLYGRLKNLSEIRGLEYAVRKSISENRN